MLSAAKGGDRGAKEQVAALNVAVTGTSANTCANKGGGRRGLLSPRRNMPPL